jgi:uncharacterized membrane protein SpoIIM required for sporulation
MQHHISAIATRAMERWRFLAHEGLARSRTRARPENIGSVENFTAAYRRSATELARVRAFSPDRQLADYIESSVATAHFAVYKRRRPKVMHAVRGALFHFPGLVRKYWAYHLAAILITAVATTIAYTSVWYDPDTYYLFVGRGLAGGRDPSASTELLRSTLGPQETSPDMDAFFTSMLFTHNTRVAFMCFAFGIILGLPTIYFLIVNGLMLGAFTSLFVQRGLGIEYFAWILPHGVPEFGAIFLCGGAGLALGHRILNPGNRPRSTALRLTAQDACLTALGCVPLLAMAGLIEGVFRQSYASTELRYGLFALMLIGLGTWIAFTRSGSRVAAHG